MIHDKEILIDELEEHLNQVNACCLCLKNPFLIIPHPILFGKMGSSLHNEIYGEIYDGTTVDDYVVAQSLDKMMREIIDLR